jgi:hypothetical protein
VQVSRKGLCNSVVEFLKILQVDSVLYIIILGRKTCLIIDEKLVREGLDSDFRPLHMSTYHNIHHRDIDASSSGSDSDLFESPEHDQRRRTTSLSRALLPVIPDLRFEQSYLKSIQPYVHIEEAESQELRVVNEKGKGKEKAELPREGEEQREQLIRRDVEPIVDSSHHLVRIEWGRVAWVTTRDQIISPLLQGALW